jgi:hypothetical protein
MKSRDHRWKFVRCGGVEQVAIRDGADIAALQTLDPKLWVSLACSVQGQELDAKTLAWIDTDEDGRIRIPEILATIEWLQDALTSLDVLMKGGDELALRSINAETALGQGIITAAHRIVDEKDIAKDDACIKLADATEAEKTFSARPWNGDGVLVPSAAAQSPNGSRLEQLVQDIIATHGAETDRSGQLGIDTERVTAFFAEAKRLVDWHAKAEQDPQILILAESTESTFSLITELTPKVEDFFARCRLAAFDDRAIAVLNGTEAEYLALVGKELSLTSQDMAKLPLAKVGPGSRLPLVEGVNPAWADKVSALRDAMAALLGMKSSSLSETEWKTAQAKLAPFHAWYAEKPTTKVDSLGIPKLKEVLSNDSQQALLQLIDQDLAADGEYKQVAALLKLSHLQRDFVKLLNNFVNFSDFFQGNGAIFQAGRLYLDGRCCELCIHVADVGKHAAMAGLAKTYLAYCDCVRASGEKLSIVAAFTGGSADHLMVGRNGIFYDRQGRDFDATVTKIIENPISIRQAFFAPYKQFVRMVEEQMAKRASVTEPASGNKPKEAAQTTSAAEVPTEAEPKPLLGKKIDLGTLAALGVAVGGIATFFSSILALLFGLGPWMPLGILAAVLCISLPSMFIAWLKLRQRSLGPLLDANGWAINGLVRINVPLGSSLTSIAKVPPNAERSLRDPYQDRRSPWLMGLCLTLLVAALGLWYLGKVDRFLPKQLQRSTVLRTGAQGRADAPSLSSVQRESLCADTAGVVRMMNVSPTSVQRPTFITRRSS